MHVILFFIQDFTLFNALKFLDDSYLLAEKFVTIKKKKFENTQTYKNNRSAEREPVQFIK